MNKNYPSIFVSLLSGICLSLLLLGCTASNNTSADDRLLAEVGNKSLYLSDLDGMIPAGMSREDSSVIIKSFADRWVREAVMMNEAEKRITKDLNIDDLVRDYRASLIKLNYEQLLVEEYLDTIVTDADMQAFYQENGDNFTLEEDIVRGTIIKVPLSAPDIAQLRQSWQNNDAEAIKAYAATYAHEQLLDEEDWYDVNTFDQLLPPTLFNQNDPSVRNYDRKDDEYQYFVKVLEVAKSGDKAPLGYLRKQIRRYILQKRQAELLDEKRRDIYEREMRRNNIKLHDF